MHLNGIGCVKRDGKWGAIGADGKLCVPLEWDDIEGFGVRSASDDAVARTNTGALLGLRRNRHTTLPDCFCWVRRDGLWGLIDRAGTVVADPIWEIHDGDSACRFDGEWTIELSVSPVEPEDEETPLEGGGAAPEADTERCVGNRRYRIEVRRVEQKAVYGDEGGEGPGPDSARANESPSGTVADDDWDEGWDDEDWFDDLF